MSKKIVIALMLLVLCIGVFAGCTNKDVSLLENGNFEHVSTETNFVTNWKTAEGSSGFTFQRNISGEDSYLEKLGNRYLKVDKGTSINAKEYLGQTIKLKKGKVYKISADIKVESVKPANDMGVRVGIVEDDSFKGINITTKTNYWKNYEAYFECGTNKELTLMITLGDKNSNVAGTFFIDNVVLEETKNVPAEIGALHVVKLDKTKNLETPGSIAFVTLMAILLIFIAYALYFILRKVNTPKELLVKKADGEEVTGVAKALISPIATFIYIVLGAFAVRFIIMMVSYGFNGTVDVLGNYATLIKEKGFLSVLTGKTGLNESMGVVYLVGLLQQVAELLNIESGSLGYSILLRMPNLLADIVICYMIYTYSQNRLSESHAAVFAAAYAFLPLFFILGGLYGSTLPIAFAFMIAAFMGMIGEKNAEGKAESNYITSGAYYTLALIFSNYMLLLLPVFLIYQIYVLVKGSKKDKLEVALTMVFSFVFFFIMSIAPCYAEIEKGNALYIFKNMYVFFKTQAFLTADTFNLYAIFGQGNLKTRALVFEVFNWLFVLSMIGCMAYAYISKKLNDKNDEADTNLLLMASLMVGAYSILGANAVVELLPISIMLLLLYLALKPEKRLYNIFTGMSLLSFLNISGILSINGVISNTQTDKIYSFVPKDAFFITFSIFAVALLFYYAYVAISMVIEDYDRVELPPMQRKFTDELKYILSFAWVKKLVKKRK